MKAKSTLGLAMVALLSPLFAEAGQLAGSGELLATRCSEQAGALVDCVAVVELPRGPVAFAIDKNYELLVGTRVMVINNGAIYNLVGPKE